MADRLSELLAHTADQHLQGAHPPSLPADWRARAAQADDPRGRRRPSRRDRRIWAPLAAAAAVVALVVPTVLLGQDAATPPITFAGGTAKIGAVGSERVLSDDAGTAGTFRPGPEAAPACATDSVVAALDLTAGQARLGLMTGVNACTLREPIRLELAGVAVEHLAQPEVPNPPSFDGQLLDASGLLMNATWSGSCDAVPTAGVVRGIGTSSVPLAVSGTPRRCSGDSPPALAVGPAHRHGSAGAIVPADRGRLQVTVALPEEVREGEQVDYSVTLTNPTSAEIALRPCPTYAYTLQLLNGMGFGGNGRLPCQDLPEALPGRTAVRLTGEVRLPTSEPGTQSATAELVWQIAGPEKATATSCVVRPTPRELAAVPYLPPGDGDPPAQGTFRYRSGGGAFPILIDGPSTVPAGSTLRYQAVLTNPAGADPIPLRPCPGWTETFVVAPSADPNPTPIERRGPANCAQAPEQIGPGETISFEMELELPASTSPGPYQLFWGLYSGLVSAPFDVTVTP